MDEIEMIRDQLKRHEGKVKVNGRHVAYRCSSGYLTVGYGRNLETRGLSNEEADLLLNNDIANVVDAINSKAPWVSYIGVERQAVFINMAINLGVSGLFGFKKAMAAAEAGDFELCAKEMKDSRWYKQVGVRAVELCEQMRTGEWQ